MAVRRHGINKNSGRTKSSTEDKMVEFYGKQKCIGRCKNGKSSKRTASSRIQADIQYVYKTVVWTKKEGI
jgi:hypothetical protein